MDKHSLSYKVAIIDPVGIKAGLDHYDVSLAKALSESGIPSIVYSNFENKGAVKQFPFTFSRGFYSAIKIIFFFILSLVKAKISKVDVIINHVFHASAGTILLVRISRFFGFRLCTIIHDVESLVYSPAGIRKLVRIVDYAIVHNQFTALQLKMKISETLQKKVHVVSHGNYIDLKSPCMQDLPVKFEATKKYLLFFGMIKRSKGLELLLDAMSALPSSIQLVIAGRNRDSGLSQYQPMINRLTLSDRIHSIGRYITNEERNCLFQKCDIVVLPYRRIYQSGVMLMAMSYRKPVIASDLIPNREIINGKNGLLFTSGNAAELALAIRKVAGDEALAASLAANGYEYVREHHDWKKIAIQVGKIFG